MSMVIYLRRASVADISRFTADSSGWEDFAFDEVNEAENLVDFDKAWHALHFMLTGGVYDTESPLGIIAGGGETHGMDEHGFGGFYVIEPARMVAFASALSQLSDETLAARYDPEAMLCENIYLADAFAEEGDEMLDYVFQGVPALRRFAASCAANGDGALRILA